MIFMGLVNARTVALVVEKLSDSMTSRSLRTSIQFLLGLEVDQRFQIEMASESGRPRAMNGAEVASGGQSLIQKRSFLNSHCILSFCIAFLLFPFIWHLWDVLDERSIPRNDRIVVKKIPNSITIVKNKTENFSVYKHSKKWLNFDCILTEFRLRLGCV